MHAREAGKHPDGSIGSFWLCEVEFDDLVAGSGANIFHITFDSDRIAGFDT